MSRLPSTTPAQRHSHCLQRRVDRLAHLLHKALQQMRQLSPAYFERFVAQVDGLMWLEQALGETAGREPAGGRPRR